MPGCIRESESDCLTTPHRPVRALHPFACHPLPLREQPVHIDALAAQLRRVSFLVFGALPIGRNQFFFQKAANSRDLGHVRQLLSAELGERVVDFDGFLRHEILPGDLPRRVSKGGTADEQQHKEQDPGADAQPPTVRSLVPLSGSQRR